MKRINRSNARWIIVAICIVILAGFVVGLTINVNKLTTTKTLSAAAYDIGSLDANGKVTKSSENIYTKDYVTVDGLKITIDEKADVQYKLFFYDADKVFLSSSEAWLTADFNGSIPETAKYVRIVIDPIDDAEVSALELVKYAGQLTVTYNK